LKGIAARRRRFTTSENQSPDGGCRNQPLRKAVNKAAGKEQEEEDDRYQSLGRSVDNTTAKERRDSSSSSVIAYQWKMFQVPQPWARKLQRTCAPSLSSGTHPGSFHNFPRQRQQRSLLLLHDNSTQRKIVSPTTILQHKALLGSKG